MTGDTVKEPNETIIVDLLYPLYATIATPTGTGTITDDDTHAGAVDLVAAGDRGRQWLEEPDLHGVPDCGEYPAGDGGLRRRRDRARPRPGRDYTAITGGTLTFAVGTTSQTFNVSVTGDTDVEPHETGGGEFEQRFGGDDISAATGTGTIVNDDGSSSLSVSSPECGRGGYDDTFHGVAEHGALGVCAGDLVGYGRRGHRDGGTGLWRAGVQQPRPHVADLRSGRKSARRRT